MVHGWQQGSAVSIMRRVRPDLEREHARILRTGSGRAVRSAGDTRKSARRRYCSRQYDPVFLTLASKRSDNPQRLKNGGPEIVRVEHVHINEVGQALIGNVRREEALGINGSLAQFPAHPGTDWGENAFTW